MATLNHYKPILVEHRLCSLYIYPCTTPWMFADWLRSLSTQSSLLLPSSWAPPGRRSEAPAAAGLSVDLSQLSCLVKQDKRYKSSDSVRIEIVNINLEVNRCKTLVSGVHSRSCYAFGMQWEILRGTDTFIISHLCKESDSCHECFHLAQCIHLSDTVWYTG